MDRIWISKQLLIFPVHHESRQAGSTRFSYNVNACSAKEVSSLIELASTLYQCSPPTRAIEMLQRPPLAVASENPKPKIENGLFFLFLLWSLFFCSMSRRRTGFALFLFLRDHFRSCGCGFCFRRCSFFLHHRRHDRECRQIELYFCRYSRRKLNVTDVNGIADIQLRNVNRDPVR